MRSALLVAALAVGGVNAYEKQVYVTDWTTVTVTKTVTASPVTITVPAAQQVHVQTSTSSIVTPAPSPAEIDETSSSSDLAKKSTIAPAPPAATPQEPAPEAATTSYFSTAWTSTWQATPTVEASTSTTSTPSAAGTAATNAYQSAVLHNHNVHRSNHSAPDLLWSSDLEQAALALAHKCVYEHDTSINANTIGTYGQNIGYGTTSEQVGVMISNLMYNDEMEDFLESYYGLATPPMTNFDKWGHFSQIVWKGTQQVGCATVTCPQLGNVDGSSLPFTVCNYHPAGNIEQHYGTNILRPGTAGIYVAS